MKILVGEGREPLFSWLNEIILLLYLGKKSHPLYNPTNQGFFREMEDLDLI